MISNIFLNYGVLEGLGKYRGLINENRVLGKDPPE